MAQGMKRLGMPVAALLGVVLIGLIATSWLLNRDALAPGGGGADPRRDRARSRGQRQHRRLGVSRQLRLVSRRRPEGRRHRRPRARGRRADRESAAAAAVAAAVRDRRRHDAAAADPRRPRRRWRQQLDAVHRDHRAHHEARRRQPGVVLGNPDPGRRADLRGRRQSRRREARRYRPVAGLALDLALLCRDRPVRLARRARRRQRSASAISSPRCRATAPA